MVIVEEEIKFNGVIQLNIKIYNFKRTKETISEKRVNFYSGINVVYQGF